MVKVLITVNISNMHNNQILEPSFLDHKILSKKLKIKLVSNWMAIKFTLLGTKTIGQMKKSNLFQIGRND